MGFFMRIRGEGAPSAGNGGLVDALSEIFSPSKKHSTEQQQYDSRVGRREQTSSGRPLDFESNTIDIVVKKPKADPAP
ncbi:MAG TPA: hypothetical protein DCQ04_15350 [Actinobacteria bacterium]|jgi:hypothetical protein|nr:hypothetical protein [Actinomycetota bacterium]